MQESVSDIVKSIFRFNEVYHIMTNTDQWTHQCRLPFQQSISAKSFNLDLLLEEAQRKHIYMPSWTQNWTLWIQWKSVHATGNGNLPFIIPNEVCKAEKTFLWPTGCSNTMTQWHWRSDTSS